MSPTEFDLRAALRDGEGDGPDPDSVLAAGRARASARRSRLTAVTGAVVAVLAVGTTAGILLSRNDSRAQSSADRAGSAPMTNSSKALTDGRADGAGAAAAPDAPAPNRSSASSSDAPSRPESAAGSTSAAMCPSTFGTRLLPGGGGSGQFGSDGPLFSGSITSVVVCGYGSTGGGEVAPGRLVLTGSDASRLVASLDNAPKTRAAIACPDYRVADDHRLVFIGVTNTGTSAPIYTTLGNPSCSVQVSNGTSVRYNWSPPSDLRVKLFAIQPI